jgi:hypothetical protein
VRGRIVTRNLGAHTSNNDAGRRARIVCEHCAGLAWSALHRPIEDINRWWHHPSCPVIAGLVAPQPPAPRAKKARR